MSSKQSFQEIIQTLINFWKGQGCLVLQPYNIQVGAGTMNPATALRILGPEPWNAVYVERSIRPEDGRFGTNLNRLQMHHQLQVILKPDPGHPQELFLQSLEAIGIEPGHNDVRFVEDNYSNSILDIWGLGWEVWLNGQEISQFTYLQQAGGFQLDPVSVEISYGLDRIALALQGAQSIFEINYGNGLTYGHVHLESEIEHCDYYFNKANIDSIKQIVEHFYRESIHCLNADLVVPAHDYNLKCAHLVKVLDVREAVGISEKANHLDRLRLQFQKIASQYLKNRETKNFPLLAIENSPPLPAPLPPVQTSSTKETQSFLLEIGTEELPGSALRSAIQQLRTQVPELLERLNLTFGRVEVDGTPRRISINVHFLAGEQKNDNSTETRQTVVLLAEELPQLIAGIQFNRSMRWNAQNIQFCRPIRWIVALYGQDLIPFSYAGINSGRTSRGIRPDRSPEIRITDAYTYAGIMRKNGVTHVAKKRREKIEMVAAKLAAEKNGHILKDSQLMDEVVNLVERPTPLRGEFDPQFLSMPHEVLIAVMKNHQCYFPIYNAENQLLPYFLGVRNGDEKHLDVVVKGNEQVLQARFEDARFFYQKDTEKSLSDLVPKLAAISFQPQLGSMLDKVKRLEQLVGVLSVHVQLSPKEQTAVLRAAALSKADLASWIVKDMESLKGIMGGHYAALQGESSQVALAISEQYLAVSSSRPGLVLAIADRLDSLVGLFTVGSAPSASHDPYRLHRMARHLIENLIENVDDCDLEMLIQAASNLLPITCPEETQHELLAFINGRFAELLRERGYANGIVQTILLEEPTNPPAAYKIAKRAARLTL